jgi:hypothetical protein
MVRTFGVLSLLIASSLAAPAQQTKSPDPKPDEVLKAATEKSDDVELVYGRIKELKGGQRIVIQVDNAPDKTYNLADKDRTITVADALAIGDRVKVLESKETKGVQIVRDVKADQEQRSRTEQKK